MIGTFSTHVLDTSIGRPASGIPVTLEYLDPDGGVATVGDGITDGDGRVGRLNSAPLAPGEFRLTFRTADYFSAAHGAVFYPRIVVHVVLADRDHAHVPVLASTYSFSTYLGS